MYERNSTVALEGKWGKQAPAQKLHGPACRAPNEKPSISANLSAGMLENNRMKRPRGAIDFFLSIAAHGLLLATAIMLPLYFSEAIDLHQMEMTYLVAPPLPPPPPPAGVVSSVRRPRSFFANNKLYAPRVIPKHIAQVKDSARSLQPMGGVPGGVIGGVPGGQLGGVIGGILSGMGHPIPPPQPKPVMHHGPYLVGGRVQAPRIIRQIQPVYPILAREARIQGAVVIDSVINEHGEVTQMKLVSGSPLLARAAFDAVGQWRYEPTLLNGTPVAVEMEVTVHFNLGS
jgi:periplasmic protein TonB